MRETVINVASIAVIAVNKIVEASRCRVAAIVRAEVVVIAIETGIKASYLGETFVGIAGIAVITINGIVETSGCRVAEIIGAEAAVIAVYRLIDAVKQVVADVEGAKIKIIADGGEETTCCRIAFV